MEVDPRDGCCRSCGGTLKITAVDDATMTVECQEPDCNESYLVEPDAFGDGCMTYYLGVIEEKLLASEDDP